MTDKQPPIGFRLDYLPMSYEVSPMSPPASAPIMSPLDFATQEPTQSYIIDDDSGCSWIYCNVNGPFPTNMVRGGVDADGAVIYIGRAFHEGDMLPAKVIPDKNVAYICYGGEEHLKEDFEVLRSGDFVWEFATSGTIPEGAVKCGQTSDGEPLYVGRALYQGTQTPGKIQVSHGCLYIPFNGEEVSITEYEVLCLK